MGVAMQIKLMSTNREDSVRVGITMGDYNGIGPEVILKTFKDDRMFNGIEPVVYGSVKVLKLVCNNRHHYYIVNVVS